MLSGYTRCSHLQDRLFDANYEHTQLTGNCEHCDVSKLVNRPARDSTDPKIHYGVIASGNQVMKDGLTRDRLAQELDAICFEMEAAGIMDSFPCIPLTNRDVEKTICQQQPLGYAEIPQQRSYEL